MACAESFRDCPWLLMFPLRYRRATTVLQDKFAFLKKANDMGIKNIEMEAASFAAFCRRAGVQAAVVCAAILVSVKGAGRSIDDGVVSSLHPFMVCLSFLIDRIAWRVIKSTRRPRSCTSFQSTRRTSSSTISGSTSGPRVRSPPPRASPAASASAGIVR